MKDKESRELPLAAPITKEVSDKQSRGCYEEVPQQKQSPQQRQQEKIVERVREWTGCEFAFFMAEWVHDAMRTGLRATDKEEEEAKGYRLHCNAEYHFLRMTGRGAPLVPALYAVSMHLASESRNFHISLEEVAKFLGMDAKNNDAVYGAASLLVASGFWLVIEKQSGKPTKYTPIGHKEWAERCGGDGWYDAGLGQYVKVGRYCTVKAQFPFNENTPERVLGRKLHGIVGEKYFAGVLKGWLKLGTTEELETWAKDFMVEDAGQQDGISRRVRLGDHFRAMAARRPK
jgi:hypothetical protein